MARYKVIALSVSGVGKKIHYLHDEVTEANFPEGRAVQLVKDGFLAVIEEVAVVLSIPPVAPAPETTDGAPGAEATDPPNLMAEFDDITIPELKEFLNGKAVAYDSKATKPALYELYTNNWNISTK